MNRFDSSREANPLLYLKKDIEFKFQERMRFANKCIKNKRTDLMCLKRMSQLVNNTIEEIETVRSLDQSESWSNYMNQNLSSLIGKERLIKDTYNKHFDIYNL
jgi:hypothetical protein